MSLDDGRDLSPAASDVISRHITLNTQRHVTSSLFVPYNQMEHRLWKTLRGKQNEGKTRISPFLMPLKASRSKRSHDQKGSNHSRSNLATGLTKQSVNNSYSSMSPTKCTIPQQAKTNSKMHRNSVETREPVNLQTCGLSYMPVHEQNIIYGSSTLSSKKPKDAKIDNASKSKKLSKKTVAKEPKVLSLPRIPSSQRQRSRSIQGKSDVQQFATHLNLIDGRRKSRSFSNADSSKVQALSNQTQDIHPHFHLETQLSLPKITMDEVLKSWDVHPTMPLRKRSARKYDPMDFLIRQEMENSTPAAYNLPKHTYDELKSCRYLRLGKEMEEELSHKRCCPCNSCEHGQGLKESPYLNA